MKVCLAGEGGQGTTHMNVMSKMEDVEVVTLAGGLENDTAEFAQTWNIPHYSMDLEECLGQDGVEAVILTSPNQVHEQQTTLALEMGKHVLVEIPFGLNVEESRRIAVLEEKTGLVCMVCHTMRYMGGVRELRRLVREGELHPHHLVIHTYFFRRENINRFGKPRTWTDDLLWHQACHAIDFVYWMFEGSEMEVWGQAGPLHPKLQIPMDMSISMQVGDGCLVTAAMSFNNHGPIQADYRVIGEENTYLYAGGQLTDREGKTVDVPEMNTGEAQAQEFFDAINTGEQPLTSCRACLPVMELLDRIQQSMNES